jgi:Enoyl-(Acyl carrier protein) reductase
MGSSPRNSGDFSGPASEAQGFLPCPTPTIAFFCSNSLCFCDLRRKSLNPKLVRTMAVEWGPHQVRTNAIAPRVVRTEFSRLLWETPDVVARAIARVPMGRVGEADDVAGFALLSASPAGSFIVGQIIGVVAEPAPGKH